eukprot:1434801-Alexandrium_andersonii.AAC.1
MTSEERKFLPRHIQDAQMVPVTHEQKTFDGLVIDSHRQVRAMENSEGERSHMPYLGKTPLRFIHASEFKDYPQFGFSDEVGKITYGPQLITKFLQS